MSGLWAAWARGPMAPAQVLRRPLSPWAAVLVALCWIVTAPLVLLVGMVAEPVSAKVQWLRDLGNKLRVQSVADEGPADSDWTVSDSKEIGEWLVPRPQATTSQVALPVRTATHAGC